MKIKIIGAGIAGSYLYRLLKDSHSVDIYDPNPKRGCGCAWGCFEVQLEDLLKKVKLKLDDYILCKNQKAFINGVGVKVNNLVTINKPKLVSDLCPEVVRKKCELKSDPEYDLTVNATAKPSYSHYTIPTVQYRVGLEGLKSQTDCVYIHKDYAGYAWAFSLDKKGETFHLGAGCINSNPKDLIKKLVDKYDVKVKKKYCKCEVPIRVVDPKERVFVEDDLINVGEAAGATFPVTGEGIIPSMDSARLVAEAVEENNLSLYEEGMEELLTDYGKAFKLWKLMEKNVCLSLLPAMLLMKKRSKTRAQPKFTARDILALCREGFQQFVK